MVKGEGFTAGRSNSTTTAAAAPPLTADRRRNRHSVISLLVITHEHPISHVFSSLSPLVVLEPPHTTTNWRWSLLDLPKGGGGG
ncbi:hypothetical protein Hanom_Chr06g00547081 [Helianthus anomalus]